MFQSPELFILRIPAILIALTIHEFAHGFVAYVRGDTTARDAGRLSLNPLAHLDLFGTIMMLFGPFGWAKPVPVDGRMLKNPRRDMILVSLAGPVSNVLCAIVVGITFRLLISNHILTGSNQYIIIFFQLLFMLNLGLSFFNLIPIPPLDGSNVLMGLLPPKHVYTYMNIMRYVPQLLLILIVAEWMFKIPVFSTIFEPLWKPYYAFFSTIILGGMF